MRRKNNFECMTQKYRFSWISIPDFIKNGNEKTLRELRELGLAHTFSLFLNQRNVLGLVAACQIAAISGKQETPESDVSEGQKIAVDHIVDAVEVFLREGDIYSLRAQPEDLLSPLRLFCTSDKLKPRLANRRTFTLLIAALAEYIATPRIRDIVVEALLELSFFTDDVALLKQTVAAAEGGEWLVSLLHRAKQDGCFEAVNLLFRLTQLPPLISSDGDAKDSVQTTATPYYDTAGKHIMLSYSWRYRKDKVVSLAAALRAVGFDVWRDEEGSSVLHPMGGCADETMAKAVEKSFMVVCCICRDYKESPNCRSEAQYAKLRHQQGKVDLVHVMLDDSYHPQSSVSQPDGWLGLMVGNRMWYPCWDITDADKVAIQIRDRVDHYDADNQQTARREVLPPEVLIARLSEADVQLWMTENHFESELVTAFRLAGVDGAGLMCLHRAARREPVTTARMLCEEFGVQTIGKALSAVERLSYTIEMPPLNS